MSKLDMLMRKKVSSMLKAASTEEIKVSKGNWEDFYERCEV